MNEREITPSQYDAALRCTYDELYELNLTRNTYRVIYHDPEKYASPPMEGSLGGALSKAARQMVHPDDRARFLAFFDPFFKDMHLKDCARGEFRILRKDGQFQWSLILAVPMDGGDGGRFLLAYAGDLGERHGDRELARQNELLRQRQLDIQRYRIIVERTNTIVLEWSRNPDTFYDSPGTAAFTFSKHLHKNLNRSYLSYQDVHPEDWKTVRAAVRRMREGAADVEAAARLRRNDGSWLWCKCTATAIRNSGEITRLIVTVNDIDAAVKAQRALAYRTEYDQLTGYGNFEKYKREVRGLLKNWDGKKYSLWYLDFKNFKYINDIYGYDTGDKLLRHWADVIAAGLRPGEMFARISADNFTVFRFYETKEELEVWFFSVLRQMQDFEALMGKRFPVELVAGVYSLERAEELFSVEDMIDRANMAQKNIKGLPGSRMAFYTEEMRSRVILEKAMESDMERALSSQEFHVYLQGQVDIQHENKISGAEALVRWVHPARGLLPPSDFVPLFEKNGFIVELDHYMFESVCKYLAGRMERGESLFRVAVNASRLTLLRPDFIERCVKTKNAYQIPDGILEIECTETVLIENLQQVGETAAQLRQNGFLVGMDDFGSGYSSLNVLKDVVVDILKLDMAFFQNGLTKERDRAIVASIVSMAGALDMRVVAEGVETMEEVSFLRRIGCDVVQGYVFFRPVPMEEFHAGGAVSDEGAAAQKEGTCREAELRALSLLANGVPAAVLRLEGDPDMTMRQGMGRLLSMTGYTPGELKDEFENRFSGLIVPEDALRIRKLEERLSGRRDQMRFDYRIRRKDGAIHWITDTRFPNGDGDCFSVLSDVTAIRELENVATQNALRLQKIMDHMNGGICIFEFTGGVRPLFMNKGYYAMFGYTEDEYWRERAGDIMANLFPEDAKEILRMTRLSAQTHEPFALTYRLTKRDGSVGHVQLRAVELTEEGREFPVFLALLSDITALKETERELQESMERQQALLDNVPGGLAVFEAAEPLTPRYVTEGVWRMSGLTRQEYVDSLQSHGGTLLYDEDRKKFWEIIQRAAQGDGQFEFVYPAKRANGSGWTMARGRIVPREGALPLLYVVFLDVTAQKEAEMELKIQAERYSLLEKTLQETLFEYDVSMDTMEVTYRDRETVKHKRMERHLEWRRRNPNTPPEYTAKWEKAFLRVCKTPMRVSFELPLRNNGQRYRWHRVLLSSVAGEWGEVIRVVGRVFDIDEEVRERQRVENLAMRDQMTWLYNKVSGELEIRRRLENARAGERFVLVMLDIDNFKQVNDGFGHAFGDEVLEKASGLLREIFPADAVLVRFGGDEFLVFMTGEGDPAALTSRFQASLCDWQNQKCPIQCSAGVIRSGERDFTALFKAADAALYNAKETGRNRCVFQDMP